MFNLLRFFSINLKPTRWLNFGDNFIDYQGKANLNLAFFLFMIKLQINSKKEHWELHKYGFSSNCRTQKYNDTLTGSDKNSFHLIKNNCQAFDVTKKAFNNSFDNFKYYCEKMNKSFNLNLQYVNENTHFHCELQQRKNLIKIKYVIFGLLFSFIFSFIILSK